MTSGLTYHFEDLQLGKFEADGIAAIDFDRDGEWEIHSAVLTQMFENGNPRADYVSVDTVKAALLASRAEGIQGAVNEALQWEPVR